MMIAPSWLSTRLNAARFAASIVGTVAPRISSVARNAPSGAGVDDVPPEPCRSSAMHCTAPFSNGGGARLIGSSTPGSALTRDVILLSVDFGSSSVDSNIMNPPPVCTPPASAGR